jgi:hypothetical protein
MYTFLTNTKTGENQSFSHPRFEGGKRLTGRRVALLSQRIPPGEQDPIHAPLIEEYRRTAGLPPGGVDQFGNRVGPSDAEIKYGGLLAGMGHTRWLPSVVNRRNAAEVYFNSTPLIDPPGGLTTQFINGTEVHSNYEVESAIPRPPIQTRTEGATSYAWFSHGVDVTGHTRMDIFSNGPWDFSVTRAQAAVKYSWEAACSTGTGNVTIHVDGRPNDAALESYIRRGEAEHDADTQQAFQNTIAQYVTNVTRLTGDTSSTRTSGANPAAAQQALKNLENRDLLTDFVVQLNAATARRHAGGRHSSSMTGLVIAPDCSRVTATMEAGTL